MPSAYVHIILTLLIFIPILMFLQIFSWDLIALIALFGVIIDLDHFIYFGHKLGTPNLFKILKKMNDDLKNDSVHFYPFHTIEFFSIFAIILFVKNFDTTLNLLFFAALLNWIIDGIRHYFYHRNLSWLKYFSIFYYSLRSHRI